MINYLIVFITVFAINVVPFLMPPTWLVLGFFHNSFIFDVLTLALVGAIASTMGRVVLSYFGTFFRRFAGKHRKKDMDVLGKAARQNPAKAFVLTFAYALSPLPSNAYFISVGLAKARTAAVFAGFFAGRLISYYVLIHTTRMIFRSLDFIFAGRLTQIIVVDIISVILMLLFVMVDWHLLFTKKKLKFMPLKMPFRKS